MTKNFPKNVLKNQEKPRRSRVSPEIIRHFDPLQSNTTCRTDLQAEIPQINANIDREQSVANQRAFTPKKRRVISIPNSYYANIPVQGLVAHQHQSKNIPQNVSSSKFKSSSSSSVDVKIEKYANRAKVRSQSLHAGQGKKKAIGVKTKTGKKSSPQISNGQGSGSLNSVTDPALLKRELNLKSLREEILDNKRATAFERLRPTTNPYTPISSPRLKSLKDEIYDTRNKNTVHKKLLITELKSEIAQYRNFSSFQVYSQSSSSPNRESQGQSNQNLMPKSIKRTSGDDNRTKEDAKSSKDGFEDLNAGSSQRSSVHSEEFKKKGRSRSCSQDSRNKGIISTNGQGSSGQNRVLKKNCKNSENSVLPSKSHNCSNDVSSKASSGSPQRKTLNDKSSIKMKSRSNSQDLDGGKVAKNKNTTRNCDRDDSSSQSALSNSSHRRSGTTVNQGKTEERKQGFCEQECWDGSREPSQTGTDKESFIDTPDRDGSEKLASQIPPVNAGPYLPFTRGIKLSNQENMLLLLC